MTEEMISSRHLQCVCGLEQNHKHIASKFEVNFLRGNEREEPGRGPEKEESDSSSPDVLQSPTQDCIMSDTGEAGKAYHVKIKVYL